MKLFIKNLVVAMFALAVLLSSHAAIAALKYHIQIMNKSSINLTIKYLSAEATFKANSNMYLPYPNSKDQDFHIGENKHHYNTMTIVYPLSGKTIDYTNQAACELTVYMRSDSDTINTLEIQKNQCGFKFNITGNNDETNNILKIIIQDK